MNFKTASNDFQLHQYESQDYNFINACNLTVQMLSDWKCLTKRYAWWEPSKKVIIQSD